MGKAGLFTTAAGVYLFLVLLKDGTIPGLISDTARGATDFAKGIKPLSTIG